MSKLNNLAKTWNVEDAIKRRDKCLELYKQAQELIEQAHEYDSFRLCSRGSEIYYNDGLDLEKIRKTIDRSLWLHLLNKSGLGNILTTSSREKAHRSLTETVPEFSAQNVIASYSDFASRKGELEIEGLTELFRHLSWNHKTNSAVALGKKIIISNAFEYRTYMERCNNRVRGWFSMHTHTIDKLQDLERVVCRVMEMQIPPRLDCLGFKVNESVKGDDTEYESDLYLIRWFKVGTMHLTFKDLRIPRQLNRVLADHYGHALPDA